MSKDSVADVFFVGIFIILFMFVMFFINYTSKIERGSCELSKLRLQGEYLNEISENLKLQQLCSNEDCKGYFEDLIKLDVRYLEDSSLISCKEKR